MRQRRRNGPCKLNRRTRICELPGAVTKARRRGVLRTLKGRGKGAVAIKPYLSEERPEEAGLMRKPQGMKLIMGKDRGREDTLGKKHGGLSPKQSLLLGNRRKVTSWVNVSATFCCCGITPSPKATYGTKGLFWLAIPEV